MPWDNRRVHPQDDVAKPGRPVVVPSTVYEAIGGEPAFTKLVDAFYAGVAADPALRAVYPDDDLGPAAERLRLFLIQYWGGPSTYSDRRGHPRLRMRHMGFGIGVRERDAWLSLMLGAVASVPGAGASSGSSWRTTSAPPPTS